VLGLPLSGCSCCMPSRSPRARYCALVAASFRAKPAAPKSTYADGWRRSRCDNHDLWPRGRKAAVANAQASLRDAARSPATASFDQPDRAGLKRLRVGLSADLQRSCCIPPRRQTPKHPRPGEAELCGTNGRPSRTGLHGKSEAPAQQGGVFTRAKTCSLRSPRAPRARLAEHNTTLGPAGGPRAALDTGATFEYCATRCAEPPA